MADWRNSLLQWRRYVSVGAICAILHNSLMFLGYILSINYSIALVISFVALAPTGCYLHSIYTFERALSWARLMRYSGGLVAGFLINFAVMFLLCSELKLAMPIATAIATGMLFFFNYLISRWAISLHRNSQ